MDLEMGPERGGVVAGRFKATVLQDHFAQATGCGDTPLVPVRLPHHVGYAML